MKQKSGARPDFHFIVPGRGFEPLSGAPKTPVLPLDDPGLQKDIVG